MFASSEGHSAAVVFLIEHGADINKFENSFDRTALILASRYGHAAVVEILITKGADLNLKDSILHTSYTALMHAAVNGHSRIVEMLAQNGADLEITNDVCIYLIYYIIDI